jgi:hypothetical protein
MANCLWNDKTDRHRWHLANLESITMCKEYGVVGIPNLRDLNICLLGSWCDNPPRTIPYYRLNQSTLVIKQL